MGLLTMIIVGFIVGLLARALKPGHDRMGIIMTTLVGIAGSFLAGPRKEPRCTRRPLRRRILLWQLCDTRWRISRLSSHATTPATAVGECCLPNCTLRIDRFDSESKTRSTLDVLTTDCYRVVEHG